MTDEREAVERVMLLADNYAGAQFAHLSGRNCTEEQRDEHRAIVEKAVAACYKAGYEAGKASVLREVRNAIPEVSE